jgi:hypothetical protein
MIILNLINAASLATNSANLAWRPARENGAHEGALGGRLELAARPSPRPTS